MGNRGASLEQPIRTLEGFSRVTLQPGQSTTVRFPLGFAELSFFTNEGRPIMEATRYTVWIGGSSLATQSAEFQFTR